MTAVEVGTSAQPTARSIAEVLAGARRTLERIDPTALELLRHSGALIVDIRPHANRVAEGEIPDSIPVERIVLEWRLDPTCAHRLPGLSSERVVVLVCNEGYASSLAAADLKQLGLAAATDLAGGFRAWAAAGLPIRAGGTPALA